MGNPQSLDGLEWEIPKKKDCMGGTPILGNLQLVSTSWVSSKKRSELLKKTCEVMWNILI